MRNNHGEGRSQAAPRQESSDIIGTPLPLILSMRANWFVAYSLYSTMLQLPYDCYTALAEG